MATRLMLTNVRLSYPTLWTPKPYEEGDTPAWSAQFLLDPKTQQAQIDKCLAAERDEFLAKMTDKDKPKFEQHFAALGPKERRVLNGDLKGDEYEGMWYVVARATLGKQAAPVILDRQAARIAEGAEGAPYAGCYVNAQVEFWAQYGKFKRINCTLLGVQFVRDGDAFGGGKPADLSAFQSLADQGEDEDASELV